MAPPSTLTHYMFMLTDQGERAIHLATAPPAPDLQPQLVLTIRPNETVTFSRGPALSLADLALVMRFAADYPAANTLLGQHTTHWRTGEWHPLPAFTSPPDQLILNPYHLADSDDPLKIRLTCDYIPAGEIYGHKWQGVVLLRPDLGRDWDSVAVDAFVHARKLGSLLAPTIDLCHFSYFDNATQGWVEFLEK